MAFQDDVVKKAWQRSNGQCECMRRSHSHFYTPCRKQLTWENRGKPGRGGWEAHHKATTGGDIIDNCEILCWECHDSIF